MSESVHVRIDSACGVSSALEKSIAEFVPGKNSSIKSGLDSNLEGGEFDEGASGFHITERANYCSFHSLCLVWTSMSAEGPMIQDHSITILFQGTRSEQIWDTLPTPFGETDHYVRAPALCLISAAMNLKQTCRANYSTRQAPYMGR